MIEQAELERATAADLKKGENYFFPIYGGDWATYDGKYIAKLNDGSFGVDEAPAAAYRAALDMREGSSHG